MTHARVERHVYLREITQGQRTSLSVLAAMVAPGSKVLDLGTGSGALGQYLREHSGCTVDGLTINDAEAATGHVRTIAGSRWRTWSSPTGRRVSARSATTSSSAPMYWSICASRRRPCASCAGLLAPQGSVLISVPNAGYSGLVAELLEGRVRLP